MTNKDETPKLDGTEDVSSKLSAMLEALQTEETAETYNGVPAWVAENPGDFLAGEIVGQGEFFDDKYGEPRILPTLIIKDETGVEQAVIPFHKSLRFGLVKERGRIGDLIVILYTGEEPSTTDADIMTKNYRVKVERKRSAKIRNTASHPRFANK